MGNALKFKHSDAGRQPGELARFKVVQGPDFGAIFVIIGPKVTLGRGEENDIQISDLKASRVHAEVIALAGGWLIKDKGSVNGILYNGSAVREARLKLNDTIALGETTLEFTTADVGTLMLVAPPRSMEQVKAEQKHLASHQEKVQAMGLNALFGGGSSAGAGASPQKNKLILYGVLAVGVVALFIGDDGKSPKVAKRKISSDSKDLAQYLPNSEINKVSDTLFKDGFREYTNGNYSRARVQFETVLQISPGHVLATLYLQNCENAVATEVKIHLDYGKKALQAGKLRDARAHYERVMRLLFKAKSDPAYVEAEEQYSKVIKEINGGITP